MLPKVQVSNQNIKDQVDLIIFDYIEQMEGQERASKITGILTELTILQMYMSSNGDLKIKV